jgi:hypothetical protein
MSPPSSKSKNKGSVYYLLHVGFLLGLFFDNEDTSDVPMKYQLIFNRLHGFISQKTEFFTLHAVRGFLGDEISD